MVKWKTRLVLLILSYFQIFTFKVYLDRICIQKYRHALSRLRLSTHRLAIETGRWNKPTRIPLDERKCQVCNRLEDEFHFILECQLFQEYRKPYIKKYYWNRPNVIKLVELLKSENLSTVKRLATYIYESFAKRNELMSS